MSVWRTRWCCTHAAALGIEWAPPELGHEPLGATCARQRTVPRHSPTSPSSLKMVAIDPSTLRYLAVPLPCGSSCTCSLQGAKRRASLSAGPSHDIHWRVTDASRSLLCTSCTTPSRGVTGNIHSRARRARRGLQPVGRCSCLPGEVCAGLWLQELQREVSSTRQEPARAQAGV
jgi:hypothetical protein